MEILPGIHQSDGAAWLVNAAHNSDEQFVARVAAARGLCADFDGTLHPGNQWAVLRTLMTPEHQAGEQADLAAYLSRDEHDDRKDAEFFLRAVGRLHGVSRGQLEDLVERIVPRGGAVELLQGFDQRDMAVISFGLHDLINRWLMDHSSSEHSVLALRLKWSENPGSPWGMVVSCDPVTMVSNGNKGYARDVFCASRGLNPSELMVLGDAPTDVLMMHPDNVGVLIVTKIDPEPDRVAYRMRGLRKLWSRVSAVLVTDSTGSLEPLVKLRRGS
jgi:phosphoserine phosphatase